MTYFNTRRRKALDKQSLEIQRAVVAARLFDAGQSRTEIAKALDVSTSVVRKYLRWTERIR